MEKSQNAIRFTKAGAIIMEEKRDFKGIWIPKNIWIDSRLSATEKIILAEIDSLDIEGQGCYASNQYLADFCQCSERKISEAISKLVRLNYLQVKSFDGRNRILQVCIERFARQGSRNCEADKQKVQQNNTFNNIDNKINDKMNVFTKKLFDNDFISQEEKQRYNGLFEELQKRYNDEIIKEAVNRFLKQWQSRDTSNILNKFRYFETVVKNIASVVSLEEKQSAKKEMPQENKQPLDWDKLLADLYDEN